jgi:hypothetical protein
VSYLVVVNGETSHHVPTAEAVVTLLRTAPASWYRVVPLDVVTTSLVPSVTTTTRYDGAGSSTDHEETRA